VIAPLIDLMINKPARIVSVCLQAFKLSWQSWCAWDLAYAVVLLSMLCRF